MKIPLFLATVLLVCAALAGAACLSTAPSASPAQPYAVTPALPAPPGPLAALALTPEDVPAGYVLTESRAKNISEVGSLAISLGWGEGYVVQYTSGSGRSTNATTIGQTITTYPVNNIPGIIGVIGRQEQAGTAMTYTPIPSPGIDNSSGGYVGRVHAATASGGDDTGSPVSGIFTTGDSSQAVAGQDVSEIYFARGGVLEVIRVTGPGADAATVTALARKAAARIP
jgi:hypothetical protein